MKKFLLTLAIFGFGYFSGAAQMPAGEEDFQSWNDVQLTVPLDKYFDFFTQVTMRFGKNVKRLNEGRFAAGFIWKPNKSLSFSPFYWHIRARNAAGRFRTEHRLNLRAVYRFPFKKFALSHRSWFESRLRRPLNSWRYRPSLTFEKDLPKKFIPDAKFFITEEIFYDSILKKFSRHRISAGITKTLTKHLSVEAYYLRQNDGFARPGDLNVFGMNWRVKF